MSVDYCYSCGDPAEARPESLVVVCDRCTSSGPRVHREALRYYVRSSEGGVRGPLSRSAVVDQLKRGALAPTDYVRRLGESFEGLVDHGDFLSWYLPGSSESLELVDAHKSEKKEKASFHRRRQLKTVAAAAFMAGSLGFAGFANLTGLTVLPAELVDGVTGAYDDATATVSAQVEQAIDEDAATAALVARTDLPGGDLLDALREKHAGVVGPASWHLTEGRAARWRGTGADLEMARERLEQAVVAGPRDPEVNGALAEIYALLVERDASFSSGMVAFGDRAELLAPGSVVARRARAAAALANGSRAQAADVATHCAESPDTAGSTGSDADLGCALIAALARSDAAALSTLHRRFPGVYPVQQALALAALQSGDLVLAAEVAGDLTERLPNEATGWGVNLDVAAAAGNWRAAVKAGTKVRALAPHWLAARHSFARVLLQVSDRGSDALAEFDDIIGSPVFERYDAKAALYADAATAALSAGQGARAIELADLSLGVEAGGPQATLTKARALTAVGDTSGAEAALRGVDMNRLVGHRGARFHTGAAHLYLASGRERLAVGELDAAIEADPVWPEAWLARAQAHLAVGNAAGAVEAIETVAYIDASRDRYRSPLSDVWYPAPSWRGLRGQIEQRLEGDVRFAGRGLGTVAIVAWAAENSDGGSMLARAVEANPQAPAARAALAQTFLDAGRDRQALEQADRVLAAGQGGGLMHAVRGRALARIGRPAESEQAFRQALQDVNAPPGVHRLRAQSFADAGDSAQARKAYSELLRLAPDDTGARAALLALERAGR